MAWQKDQGKYAKQAGDEALLQAKNAKLAVTDAQKAIELAEGVAYENKTRWLGAVSTITERDSRYPNPKHGDTVKVTGIATAFRFVTGSGWVVTDEYDPTVIGALAAELASLGEDIDAGDFGDTSTGIPIDGGTF